MLMIFLPTPLRLVYSFFKDIFNEQGFSYSQGTALFLYFLTGSTSLSEFVRRCSWSPSVSTLSRMAFKFKPNRFMRRNQSRILKNLKRQSHGDFCYAIDDTSNPKYGDSVYGSAHFHSSQGVFFGQKVLVLCIVNLKTQKAIPMSYAFLTGTKEPNHIPCYERAIELLKEAMDNGFPPLPVATDSWFDSKEFISKVKEIGCDFAGEVKCNRICRGNLNPGSFSQKISFWFKDLKRVRLPQTKFQKRKEKRGKVFSEKILFIKNMFFPLKIIAVYNRSNGVKPFAYYATNNTSMTGTKLWRYSRARWAIEVLFRDLKQSLGFGCLTAGGEGGAHLSVCLPLILLTSIRIDTGDVWKAEKGESLGTIVKKNSNSAFFKSINSILHDSNSEKVEMLKARRKNPNRKPTNLCGEKLSA